MAETRDSETDAFQRNFEDSQDAGESESAAMDDERRAWDQRELLVRTFLSSLTRSWGWKLLSAPRLLRNLIAPKGFDERLLIPWRQLERLPGPDATRWRSLGSDPQFLVASFFPAGWIRIQIKTSVSIPGRLELFVDRRFAWSHCEGLPHWVPGRSRSGRASPMC